MSVDTTAVFGDLINRVAKLKAQISDINADLTELKAEKEELESQIITRLSAVGLKRAGNGDYTVSITSNIVPSVKDWDAFYAYMKANDAYYMLERRPLATAYREALEMRKGEPIPGVEPFERISLSLRPL